MDKENICLISDFIYIMQYKNKVNQRINLLQNKLKAKNIVIPNKSLNSLVLSSSYLENDYKELKRLLYEYQNNIDYQIELYNKRLLLSLGNLYFNLKKCLNDNISGVIFNKCIDYKYLMLSIKYENIFLNLSGGKYKNIQEFEKIVNLEEESEDDLPF